MNTINEFGTSMLFRAWYQPFPDTKFGAKMKYGSASSILAKAEMSPDKYTLMTGLRVADKNGKFIYEGDIYKYRYDDEIKLDVVHLYDTLDSDVGTMVGFNLLDDLAHIEIVGNVYESLELTKEVGP